MCNLIIVTVLDNLDYSLHILFKRQLMSFSHFFLSVFLSSSMIVVVDCNLFKIIIINLTNMYLSYL